PGKGESKGKLSAVVNGTTVVGWIEGHAPGGVKFAGTFTGSWSANTGFSSLQIGTSSSSNELVLLSGHCGAPKAGKGPKTNTPKTHTPKTPPPPHGKKK